MVSYVPFWLMSNRNYKLPKFQDFTPKKTSCTKCDKNKHHESKHF